MNGCRLLRRVAMQPSDSAAFTVRTVKEEPPQSQPEQMSSEDETSESERDKESEEKGPTKARDPLRWFGLLTPMPLKQAQNQAVQAVEEIIPRLVSVNAKCWRLRSRFEERGRSGPRLKLPRRNLDKSRSRAKIKKSSRDFALVLGVYCHGIYPI